MKNSQSVLIGVLITPAMGYRVISLRMSREVAVKFPRLPMESVLKCDRCGECLEKCPYDLPIPDMLKTHYDIYEKQHFQSQSLILFSRYLCYS